jgi:cysteine-rich repeat protein
MRHISLILLLSFFVFGCANSSESKGECGNEIIEQDETCDDGNLISADGCDFLCQIEPGWFCQGNPSDCEYLCGNGILDANETCDDGSHQDGDGCDSSCQTEPGWTCSGQPSLCATLCGNGILDTGEQCEGENLGGNSCVSVPGEYTGGELSCSTACTYDTTGCLLPNCGNGSLDVGEECDDGNSSNVDACLNNCKDAICGDVYVWSGVEECDDGNATNADACLTNCKNATCGDGFEWVGQEECDDGNLINTDSCVNNCKNAICSDGVVWSGHEECDDANTSNIDACLNTCYDASCGDGYLRPGHEQCDDDNTLDGDGCDSLCSIESLPILYSIDTVSGGWSQESIPFANDPHAPQTPIVAAANVQTLGKAYVFTSTTYHVISIPSKQWLEHGTLASRFPGLPGASISSAYGVSWDGHETTNFVIMAGNFYYLFNINNSSQQVTADASNPYPYNWTDPGDPAYTELRALYLALENSDGWVDVSPNLVCGATATETGPYIALVTTTALLHINEVGSCFEWCDQMSLTQFPPFGATGAPAASKIRAAFYVSPKLYVIAVP